MKKYFNFLLGSVSTLLLIYATSCSNDLEGMSDEHLQNTSSKEQSLTKADFKVENGYLNFKSSESYYKTIDLLNSKTKEEILTWCNQYDFNSLLQSYDEKELLSIEDEESCKKDFKIENHSVAALFNNADIMMINDTVYTVIDEYIYVIKSGDPTVLDELKKAPENYNSLSSVSRYQHTRYLDPVQNSKGVSDGTRSHMIEIGSKRREYADFKVYASEHSNGNLYLKYRLEGRAQKKKWWWGTPFTDELVWGEAICNYTVINDTYVPRDSTTTKVVGQKMTPTKEFYIHKTLFVNMLKANITFNFNKNNSVGKQSYTNDYHFR